MRLCLCGCGKPVKLGNRYISGHNGGMKGKRHSEETKRKIGRANAIALAGRKMPKNVARRMALSRIGKMSNNGRIGTHHTKATKVKMSLSNKTLLLWQNPEYKERQIKAIHKGNKRGMTKPERRLRNGLNKLFPKEYKFVGNGQIYFGFKNPDFININCQKKIIEMFGTFWHSKKITGRTERQEEYQRIKHFAKYGYKTLIVWQRELKDIPRLKRKLRAFHGI